MTIKNDRWIRHMSLQYAMIAPYARNQVGEGIISYGPSSFGYDMRAGLEWKIFSDVRGHLVVDPKDMDQNIYFDIKAKEGEAVVIPPNSYALTHTLETITMPRNVTAICVGKSTYARCGIHVNVTPLEAEWKGQVTIEISNATRLPVKVYAGEGIMQVLFFEGEDPSVSYADRKGKYQDQQGVTLARISPTTKVLDSSESLKKDRKKPIPGVARPTRR